MRIPRPRLLTLAAMPAVAALLWASVASAPATQAERPADAFATVTSATSSADTHDHAEDCVVPGGDPDASAAARGGDGHDHREVSLAEQARIELKTLSILTSRAPSSTQSSTRSPNRAAVAAATPAIPVYFHVMQSSTGAGDVTASQITQQVQVLNRTFAGGESSAAANTGFTFTLAGVDRFRNDTWHADGESTTYRSQTRQGGANALNIWLVDFDYLGYATSPWDYAKNPSIDGVRIQYTTLPGGTEVNFNQGKTTTHETGHWLGLYHTFQGGCTSTNDRVSDTPAQASASSGCPTGRDSCPSLAGVDPINNYMDYSHDTCYNQFTPGQSTRMSQNYSAYRS